MSGLVSLDQPGSPVFKLGIHSEPLPPCQAAKQGTHIPQSFFMRIYLILAV